MPLGVCQRTARRYMRMAQIVDHYPQLNGVEQAKLTALAEATAAGAGAPPAPSLPRATEQECAEVNAYRLPENRRRW